MHIEYVVQIRSGEVFLVNLKTGHEHQMDNEKEATQLMEILNKGVDDEHIQYYS